MLRFRGTCRWRARVLLCISLTSLGTCCKLCMYWEIWSMSIFHWFRFLWLRKVIFHYNILQPRSTTMYTHSTLAWSPRPRRDEVTRLAIKQPPSCSRWGLDTAVILPRVFEAGADPVNLPVIIGFNSRNIESGAGTIAMSFLDSSDSSEDEGVATQLKGGKRDERQDDIGGIRVNQKYAKRWEKRQVQSQ